MKYAYINPTIVAVTDVPQDLFLDLFSMVQNAHSKSELNDEGDPKISIRGGQQIQLYPNEFNLDVSKLKNYVESIAREYMDNVAIQNPSLDISGVRPVMTSAWTIKQTEGDYQTLHTHESNLSGNIYIEVPEFDSNSKDHDGNVEFRFPVTRNPAHFIFADNWRYAPIERTMVVFPGNIPHTVYPWKGRGNRTILAWDVKLVDKNS